LTPQRRLLAGVLIAGGITVLEALGGLLSNSLGLLADAGHVGTDTLSLGLALMAMRVATRPHTSESSYGYHRAEVLAALLNGTTLFVIAGYVFYEGYQRLLHPVQVSGPVLLPFALAGLAANLLSVSMLRRGAGASINLRAAYLHAMSDLLATAGVILGGVVIVLTGFTDADVLVASLIGLLILGGGFRVVRDSLRIILEQTPKEVSRSELISDMMKVEGVKSVHDLHVWSLTSGLNMMSCHVDVDEHGRDHLVLEALKVVARNHDIAHTTIQIEHHEDHEGSVSVEFKRDG
jgi:cobalt-zinc-cadmium efflux system protein